MESLGQYIRTLRETHKAPLRVVAAYIDADPAILSKIERGHRNATRDQVVKLAQYFKIEEEELLVLWMAEKIYSEIEDETFGIKALQVAEEYVEYRHSLKAGRREIYRHLKNVLSQFPKIRKAWVYGSFAREDDGPFSDIDIALMADKDFSYFDLAEVQHQLETLLSRKIDIGFAEVFKPHVYQTIQPDLKLIYERAQD